MVGVKISDNVPVFRSRKGGLDGEQHGYNVIKVAAVRAGPKPSISMHWLRHAHASHAVKRALINLIRGSLGHSNVAESDAHFENHPFRERQRLLGAVTLARGTVTP
ncbi:hypothetical protein [Azospirillum palustre]|uniref:hypothetical protein n=1 Tax=Azospirillum palustre TaxID=2044885 RepID=UPI0011788397|nr:hypothetical protein [Azospirillum palustre]